MHKMDRQLTGPRPTVVQPTSLGSLFSPLPVLQWFLVWFLFIYHSCRSFLHCSFLSLRASGLSTRSFGSSLLIHHEALVDDRRRCGFHSFISRPGGCGSKGEGELLGCVRDLCSWRFNFQSSPSTECQLPLSRTRTQGIGQGIPKVWCSFPRRSARDRPGNPAGARYHCA